MSLNESIVKDAALTWFGKLGYAVGRGQQHAPDEPAAGRGSFGDVVQFRFSRTLIRPLPAGEEKREAILAADPGIPEAARATIRDYRIVRCERRTP